MSDLIEPVVDPEAGTAPAEAAPETPDPAAEVAKWKAMSRKNEERAKENEAAAKRLAEIEEANKTESEKLQARAEAAEKALAERDAKEALEFAKKVKFPVLLKATAGGGGKGLRVAFNDKEAAEGFAACKTEAMNSFGDDRIFIEKFVEGPRHIEIQVLGDSHGNVVYLNERDCSIQRRHQKVIEEAPSPVVTPAMREAMGRDAVAAALAVGSTPNVTQAEAQAIAQQCVTLARAAGRADFLIEALPECVDRSAANPPLPPITAHDYLMQRLREINLA